VANFPDGNFRNWVLQQSYGIDGVLTDSELMEITKMSVGCKGIGSLKGIELLTELTQLYCRGNQLTALDLTRNTALTELYCWDNKLTALDVTKNTALTTLGCSNNQLTALDVSKNTALTELACYGNRIKGTNMDNLIGSLPQNTTGYSYKFYVINNNDGEEGNECTKNQAAAVKAKGWTPLCYDAAAEKWLEYEGSGDEDVKSGEGDDNPGTGLSQTDNTIYINNVEVSAGVETKLSVRMRNKAKIRGFQFDLYLPEGVTAVKGNKGKIQATLNRDRLSDDDEHTLTCNERPDGSIRLLCSSQYEETFTGNDGEVVMLLVAVNEDMAEGDYPIYLKNIKLSESNINQYYQAEQVESAMTVIGYLMGDVTGGGIVDVCDYIGVANEILGIPQEGFNMKAGDVNGDGVIDVSDYIGVANIIMTGSPYGTSTARGARKNKGVSEY
jgi:hypothetical protein